MPEHIERINHASASVLTCREVGHAWDPERDSGVTTNKAGRVIEFQRLCSCLRCGAKRKQVIEVPSFRVKTTTITYPDGYLLSGSRIHKSDVRREVLDRITRARQ